MEEDNAFRPRLGRIRAKGKKRNYLSRVIAAANLARGGLWSSSSRGTFRGSRIGRGAGVGSVLGGRDRLSAFRGRRVIVKSRIVRLSGKGLAGAKAHLRYIQRDGTTREGEPGQLYDADQDRANGRAFLERSISDRHQFRFILSAEDGAEYEDLKPLTRRLMQRMEEDLDTRLDWVAVDHFNTGYPHTHILLRGIDERGHDLIIARDYVKHGMRERAAELVDLDLGPCSDRSVEDRLRAEVDSERLTSIDRALLKDQDKDRFVSGAARTDFDQAIRIGRLRKLERLGLAAGAGAGRWRLAEQLSETLTRMGEQGDIIRTMQRALAAAKRENIPAEQSIFDPLAGTALVGRVLEVGLSDEINDRHYLILEGLDGRTHYADVGKSELGDLRSGSIVRIEPALAQVRQSDVAIAAVASQNEGRYDVDAHLRYDPRATEAFAKAHVRRLEAIRRLTGGVERNPDGSWSIASDHLERARDYEIARRKDRPVVLEVLASEPLERLIDADAATWLDHELVSPTPEVLRDRGFGKEVLKAQASRRRWLLNQGLAEDVEGGTLYRPDLIDVLRRRELTRIAKQLSSELGLPFSEVRELERIEGILRRRIPLMSGHYALIERSRDFTLVPWRPVLEPHIGRSVSGRIGKNAVSWTIGRTRAGPAIS